MAIKNIGKTFKSKSGKSTRVIFTIDEVKSLIVEHEKYGKQIAFNISGTADSEYGHSVWTFDDEVESTEKVVETTKTKESDDLPF